jgi:hypothetical protein
MVYVPVDAIVRESSMDIHFARKVVAPEHPSELPVKRHYCRIEDAVGCRYRIPLDYRICLVTPNMPLASGRLVFPWDVF